MSSPDELVMLARSGPGGLGLAADRRFAYPPHLQLIDREIVAAIQRARERRRAIAAGEDVDDRPEVLLVEMPPRHGKSTLISEHTPAWYLGRYPDDRVILASYEADFAATWGAKARALLEENGRSFFGVEVDPRSSAAKRWTLAGHKGGMFTAGVGGPITGKGAELFIIDDPIKNSEQSLSETIREKQWDWWFSTARTRLEPGALVIVLMTRWHQADLGGKLLDQAEEGGDPVRELRLPALAEKNDPLGREPGEALWPRRYSARYLEHTKRGNAYWFSAMYQGSPTPDEGGIFNRRDFHDFTLDEVNRLVVLERPGGEESYGWDWCQKFQVVDLAASEKQTADYTVIGEFWKTPDGDMLVRNIVRARIAVPDQPDHLRRHHVGGPVKVESIGYQSGLVQTMLREGFPVEPVYPDSDKVTRAGAAGVLFRAGKVYLLAGAEWRTDFELELLAFPAGEHDDQVDTVAYGARALPEIGPAKRKPRDPVGKSRLGSRLRAGRP